MIKEKIKSYILILLMVSSFLQVGILWDYKSYGFPFNFLSGFSGKNLSSTIKNIDSLKEDIAKPYRIMLSAGGEEPRWIINREDDQSGDYDILWNEAQKYLKQILTSTNTNAIVSSDITKDWGDIIAKRGIMLEYQAAIKPNLLSYLLGVKAPQNQDISSVYRVVVSPFEDINYDSYSIYIYDGDTKLQKFNLSINNSELEKEDYQKLLSKYETSTSLRTYNLMEMTKKTFPYPARKEIPIVMETSKKFETYSSVEINIPEIYQIKNGQKFSDIEKRFQTILGSERDSYDVSMDIEGNIIFKNLNNIYKISSNGNFDYRNLSTSAENEKFDEVKTLKSVLDFINRTKILPANMKLYLSSVKEEKDKMKLTFDYSISNIPVVFTDSNEEIVRPAINIEAYNNKILNCSWLLRDIQVLRDKKQYNIFFVDVMDSVFRANPKLKGDKNFSLKSATVGYHIREKDLKSAKIEPSWIVLTENNSLYSTKLSIKKGD